jgi:anti-sigma factor RsiW
MNCQQTKDLMKPFLDGALDRSTSQKLRRHLANCKECASELDPVDLMEILPVLDDSIEPSEGFSDRFYAELEARKSRNSTRERLPASGMKRSWLPRWSWGLAAAAVLTVVVSTGLYVRQSRYAVPDASEMFYDFEVTENLPLLMDMPLINNLELFENMDAIENLPQLN